MEASLEELNDEKPSVMVEALVPSEMEDFLLLRKVSEAVFSRVVLLLFTSHHHPTKLVVELFLFVVHASVIDFEECHVMNSLDLILVIVELDDQYHQ